jgi:5-methylcytosine-specific restriction endonuclease McrA
MLQLETAEDKETQVCRVCSLEKPLSEFPRNAARKNGRDRRCKECNNAYVRAWRAADPEHARQLQKQNREQNPERIRVQKHASYERHRESILASTTEWRRNNPEKRRLITRRYREGHEAELRASNRLYREANREALNARQRRWRAENPEKTALHNFQSRWGCLDADSQDYYDIVIDDPCSYCGGPTNTVDHIIARSKGGSNEWENFTGACNSCNSRKHNHSLLLSLLRSCEARHTQ